MQANRGGSEHQRRSVDVLIARSVAPASQLNPSKAIWRPSTISSGCSYSTEDIVIAQPPVVYPATKLPATGLYFCPVAQCGRRSGTRFNLRHHFLMQHPRDLICIPAEGSHPLPKCKHCGLQTPVGDLNGGHHHTELCQWGWERKQQHAAAVHSQVALGRLFTA